MITVNDADFDVLFSEAVTAGVDSPLTPDCSAVTVKVAVDDEAGTVTEAGRFRT